MKKLDVNKMVEIEAQGLQLCVATAGIAYVLIPIAGLGVGLGCLIAAW